MNIFKLTRPLNLFIVIFTMIAVRYGLILPHLEKFGIASAFPILDFILTITATVLIGAAGYVINDYFDQKIDRINRPDKTLIGTKVHRREAILFHWILSITGFLVGSFLAIRLRIYWISAVYLIVILLFWFYSTYFKQTWYKGNFIVSLLAFMVPFQIILFEYAWLIKSQNHSISQLYHNTETYKIFILVAIYSSFAFITNFIREILKDFKDIIGDARYSRKTLPIVWGPEKAKWFVQIINGLLILSLLLLYGLLVKDSEYKTIIGIYLLLFIILPLVLTIATTYKARQPQKYILPDRLIKAVMLSGIIACLLFGKFFL